MQKPTLPETQQKVIEVPVGKTPKNGPTLFLNECHQFDSNVNEWGKAVESSHIIHFPSILLAYAPTRKDLEKAAKAALKNCVVVKTN